MNLFIWDMRHEPARKVKGDTSMAFFLLGATVLPGRYQVRLTVGEQSWTESFEIVPDPRGHLTAEGARGQYDLLMRMNAKLNEGHDAVNQIRDIAAQLTDRRIWRRSARRRRR
jgi:hypothetical protein